VKIRTFVAVDINHNIREYIHKTIEKYKKIGGIRWVAKENIHITLYFFGNVEEKILPLIREVVENAVSMVEPFSVEISGISAFPSLSRPRVFWVGVKNPGGELSVIYKNVVNGLKGIELSGTGIEIENRDYTPHLTLGRVKGKFDRGLIDNLEEEGRKNFGTLLVDSVVLYRSILGREGPVYNALNTFNLRREMEK